MTECKLCEPGFACPEMGLMITGEPCLAGYFCTGGAIERNPV